MRRYASVVLLSFAALSVLLSGCVTRIADFTLMSTKNVSLGEKYVKIGRFEDSDLAWMILFIPTGFPNLKTAVDNLLDRNGGELATDVVISSKLLPLILANQTGYKVAGDVWKRASVGDLRSGSELFDLTTGPDGRQRLFSSTNSTISYTVTTTQDLESQIQSISH